jgi:hypothetical protein
MKVNQGIPSQGSFGIPPEMQAEVDNYHKKKAIAAKSADEDPSVDEAEEEEQPIFVEDGEADVKEKSPVGPNPVENLKKLGIELADDDFQKIVFRGYLEKDVVVVPSIRGTKPLKATFKTLTGAEIDEVDELLADDIQEIKMTNDGYQTRRSMWLITYGVTKLMDKPLCQPVLVKGKPDSKATMRMKKKVLAALNPGILTKIMHIHGILTVSINAILMDQESDYLKKP